MAAAADAADACPGCDRPLSRTYKYNCKSCNVVFCTACLTYETAGRKSTGGERGAGRVCKPCVEGKQADNKRAHFDLKAVDDQEGRSVGGPRRNSEDTDSAEVDSQTLQQGPSAPGQRRPSVVSQKSARSARRPSSASAHNRPRQEIERQGTLTSTKTATTAGTASKRGKTAPTGRRPSQAFFNPDVDVQLMEFQASLVSEKAGGRKSGTTVGSATEIPRGESKRSLQLAHKEHRYGDAQPVPQKEKYVAGKHGEEGVWPEGQGERPEPGDMSEFVGDEWTEFAGLYPELADLIYGCAEAMGDRRKWENHSEKLLKDMREKVRKVPQAALQECPGRRQVIMFMARAEARQPIRRKQAEELKKLFYQMA